MFLRALAIFAGTALVAAAAYASLVQVEAGLTSPYSVITIAVAGGLIVGALCVGAAWAVGHRPIAVAIALGMACGELYALILTGERVVGARETAQVVIQEAVERREAAERRLQGTEAAFTSAGHSQRVERAVASKATADRAVIEKSAEPGCASNCRALLQAQVDAAQREVDAALADQRAAQERAGRAVEAARAELASARLPPRLSPLAARLGLPAWALDLVAAGLASLAINGLGAALLAFGAHGRCRETVQAVQAATSPVPPEVVRPSKPKMIAPPRNGLAHLAKFFVDAMRPETSGVTAVRDVRAAYLRWCSDQGHDALPARDMADRLAALCDKAGLQIEPNDGNPVIRGLRLRT